MKIYDDTKIFICAPDNYYTGGPLSLHQLCSCLISLGFDARMCYMDQTENPVHPSFKKYHLPFINNYTTEYKPHNIFIIPEMMFFSQRIPAQIVVWWLSVDFYLNFVYTQIAEFFQSGDYLSRKAPIFNFFEQPELDHMYQCEYIHQFLKVNGVPDDKILHELRGYLSNSFYDNESKIDLSLKENLILYNPKKGMEFTEKLIEYAPELNFVPIQNMTPTQVSNILSKSKIYIDFGSHPGKERIPREAALSHCVVVTGKRGSAGNNIDVPIPSDCKFDNDLNDIPNIIAKLKYILDNFQIEHDRQKFYRESLLNERDNFFKSVEKVFGKRSNNKKIALVGNLEDIEFMYNQLKDESDVDIVFLVNDEYAGNVAEFENKEIEIISEDDALFLFDEKRIDEFIGR